MEFLSKHKIIIILSAIVVAVFVWYGFSDPAPANTPVLTTQQVVTGSAAERGLVETLITLRSITLSGSILTDPAFLSLRDFGTQIVQEPMGRRDPFAPLGPGGASPQGSSGPFRGSR